MIRTVTAMRRGPGREYLVLGRMMKPGRVEGAASVRWSSAGGRHAIPPVFHAAWQAPDGALAVVFANWTSRPRRVRVRDPRLGSSGVRHVVAKRSATGTWRAVAGAVVVTVPPLAMVLLEQRRSGLRTAALR